MEWIVIENFEENIEKHIKLFTALSDDNTIFFVRKETLEFEELKDNDKNEIIEENYDLFKDGILRIENENSKQMLVARISEMAEKMKVLKLEENTYDMDNFWEKLEKKQFVEYQEEIKLLITYVILKDRAKTNILRYENYAFETEKNESYKYYASDGNLENEDNHFKWYKMDGIKDIKKFIEQNLFNYNIIMTQKNDYGKQYEYYINYYEGEKNILAVRDIKGNFCKVFKDTFIDNYVVKYN